MVPTRDNPSKLPPPSKSESLISENMFKAIDPPPTETLPLQICPSFRVSLGISDAQSSKTARHEAVIPSGILPKEFGIPEPEPQSRGTANSDRTAAVASSDRSTLGEAEQKGRAKSSLAKSDSFHQDKFDTNQERPRHLAGRPRSNTTDGLVVTTHRPKAPRKLSDHVRPQSLASASYSDLMAPKQKQFIPMPHLAGVSAPVIPPPVEFAGEEVETDAGE